MWIFNKILTIFRVIRENSFLLLRPITVYMDTDHLLRDYTALELLQMNFRDCFWIVSQNFHFEEKQFGEDWIIYTSEKVQVILNLDSEKVLSIVSK